MPVLDRQPKIQLSSVEETLQRIMGQTNNDCRISDLHFDKFPTPPLATFACWKIRFKTEGMYLFTISYGSYVMDQRSEDG